MGQLSPTDIIRLHGGGSLHTEAVQEPVPAKEALPPVKDAVTQVTRVLASPHIESLPTALSEEEVRIIELHDL